MQLFTSLLVLLGALTTVSGAVDPVSVRSTTVYAWPLSSSSPSKLAEIEYNPAERSTSVLSYSPPKIPSSSSKELVRIGVYNSSTKAWLGSTVTSAASFEPDFQGTIRLHVDAEGEVWRAAFHSARRITPSDQDSRNAEIGKLRVEVLRPVPAPQPHLNKPVVLSPDGKVPEVEVERSFLQK